MLQKLNNSITPSEAVLINGNRFAARKRPVGLVLIWSIALIPSLYIMYTSFEAIEKSLTSKSWPLTQGKIESSKFTTELTNNGLVYGANVQYSYLVNGKKFQNNNLWFGSKTKTSDSVSVNQILKKYPTGRSVSVSYNPDNPQIAVLEPRLHFQSFILFSIGLIIIVIITPILIRYIRLLK